ncbi:unnamed protein product [Gordionus sp. m RMFG-2023]
MTNDENNHLLYPQIYYQPYNNINNYTSQHLLYNIPHNHYKPTCNNVIDNGASQSQNYYFNPPKKNVSEDKQCNSKFINKSNIKTTHKSKNHDVNYTKKCEKPTQDISGVLKTKCLVDIKDSRLSVPLKSFPRQNYAKEVSKFTNKQNNKGGIIKIDKKLLLGINAPSKRLDNTINIGELIKEAESELTKLKLISDNATKKKSKAYKIFITRPTLATNKKNTEFVKRVGITKTDQEFPSNCRQERQGHNTYIPSFAKKKKKLTRLKKMVIAERVLKKQGKSIDNSNKETTILKSAIINYENRSNASDKEVDSKVHGGTDKLEQDPSSITTNEAGIKRDKERSCKEFKGKKSTVRGRMKRRARTRKGDCQSRDDNVVTLMQFLTDGKKRNKDGAKLPAQDGAPNEGRRVANKKHIFTNPNYHENDTTDIPKSNKYSSKFNEDDVSIEEMNKINLAKRLNNDKNSKTGNIDDMDANHFKGLRLNLNDNNDYSFCSPLDKQRFIKSLIVAKSRSDFVVNYIFDNLSILREHTIKKFDSNNIINTNDNDNLNGQNNNLARINDNNRDLSIEVTNEIKTTSLHRIKELFDHLETEYDEQLFDYYRSGKSWVEGDEKPIKEDKDSLSIKSRIVSQANIVVNAIHANKSKFREYCDHYYDKDLEVKTSKLVQTLVTFYSRKIAENLTLNKTRSKKRMVYGMKEINKWILMDKIKCVILAPDIENVPGKGGLNELINGLIQTCRLNKIPIIFGIKRRLMPTFMIPKKEGSNPNKVSQDNGIIKSRKLKINVSAIGILNYEGAERLYKDMIYKVDTLRQKYMKDFLSSLAEYIVQYND